jgi:glucosyl-dolichyl phosphate glucuronosyltransferase
MLTLSIIVPTARPLAEAGPLVARLEAAIAGQPSVDLLIVDNSPGQAADGGEERLGERITGLRQPVPGVAAARHLGAARSASDLIGFLDDDVRPADGWVGAALATFRDQQVELAGGPAVPLFLGHVPPWLFDLIERTPYGGWECGAFSLLDIGRDVAGIDPGWVWSQNMVVRRSTFVGLGGQNPGRMPAALDRWQGDDETGFTLKFGAAGLRADYVHGLLVFHEVPEERLSTERIGRRYFIQGIRDSFTEIRGGGAPASDSVPRRGRGPAARLRRAAGRLLRRIRAEPGGQTAEIMRVAEESYLQGWRFHQREAASDPALLAWVRRESFWDADPRTPDEPAVAAAAAERPA